MIFAGFWFRSGCRCGSRWVGGEEGQVNRELRDFDGEIGILGKGWFREQIC